jgi:hypothetical protein
MPRRKRRTAAKAVAIEPEPSLFMRVLLHSPKDTMASAVAFAAGVAIVINALFLQTGHHPSPMFGAPIIDTQPTVTMMPRPRPADSETQTAPINPIDPKPMVAIPATPPSKPVAAAPAAPAAPRPPAAVPAHGDPLADLINSNRRVASVQRVLTEYGYGQLKPTGVAGTDTQAAIRKFETDRKHPATGQISDWLLQEMAKLTGKPIN